MSQFRSRYKTRTETPKDALYACLGLSNQLTQEAANGMDAGTGPGTPDAYGFPIVLKSVRAGLPDQRSVWIVENSAEALRVLLTALPASMPPIVITQHMPEMFTKSFAVRLDALCKLTDRKSVV